MNMEIENRVNLFWTGGWDSTFRLLQLAIVEQKKVQPYYLIDFWRKSLYMEIRTMAEIKEELFLRFPFAKDYILPTIFYDFHDIPIFDPLKSAYKNLTQKKPIGSQYEWLARFCHHFGINKIELCIETATGSGVDQLILPLLDGSDDDVSKKISEEFNATDEYTLFHFFRFPVLSLTKMDMYENAKKNKFLPILLRTWFCHKPILYRVSCGTCNPCKSAIKEGFSFRVSLVGRVRYFLNKMLGKIKIFWF